MSEDRTVLVTGAGGGLGREIARLLLARGLRVAVADLDEDRLSETVDAAPQRALVLPGDLTAEGAPEATVAAVVKRWGRIDMLVNNAGYGAIQPFLEMQRSTWDRTLGINVIALALLTAAAGRQMGEAGQGRIVNITSPASRMTLPLYTAYAASKAA
jgi:NAD(P)-dependent dehydrogenase (short-subunit alcohol dehydrogenase family)